MPPPILFVHGAFHGAWCYGLWIRELDRMQWPAAAIDIRDHGDVLPDEVFLDEGAEAFADDIVKAIAAMPSPPIFVGHSLGGLLVGIAASCVQVVGLVLHAPSPPNQLAGAKVIPGVPEGAAVAVLGPERTVPWFFPRWKLEDIRPVLDRLTPESPVALNDRLQLRVGVGRAKESLHQRYALPPDWTIRTYTLKVKTKPSRHSMVPTTCISPTHHIALWSFPTGRLGSQQFLIGGGSANSLLINLF